MKYRRKSGTEVVEAVLIDSVAKVGDWMVTYANGSTGLCTRDFFARTYEPVPDEGKGEPILSLKCDVFAGEDPIDVWCEVRHGIPFDVVKRGFERVRDHLNKLIADGPSTCPHSPDSVLASRVSDS